MDKPTPEKYEAHNTGDAFPAKQVPLVLASASPRRRELLALLDAPFVVRSAGEVEEQDDPPPAGVLELLPPCPVALSEHPVLRAWRKADAVQQHATEDVVLGADTVVVLDNTVLNKPTDADHAVAMLSQLAGRAHMVYTGLCVLTQQHPKPLFDLVASEVTLMPLTPEEIAAYVATGEPFDKAGGYGIQGQEGRFIQQVIGSHTAVVGLPLPATWQLLTAAGIAPLQSSTNAYQSWLRNRQQEVPPWPQMQP